VIQGASFQSTFAKSRCTKYEEEVERVGKKKILGGEEEEGRAKRGRKKEEGRNGTATAEDDRGTSVPRGGSNGASSREHVVVPVLETRKISL